MTERSRPSMMQSANSAAASGSVPSSLARLRRVATSELSDAMMRSGSRCVWTRSASGYSASSAGEAPDVAGRLDDPAFGGMARLQVLQERAMPAVGRVPCRHRTAANAVYTGTRYCTGKIMLRKSDAVIATHSCASSGPSGCMARKPGMTRSTIADVASFSAMRGSVSYVAVSGGGLGCRDLPRERARASAGSCARRS